MVELNKVICRYNAILVKIPMTFFAEVEKFIHNFICNLKTPQKLLKKKTKVGELKIPGLKSYCKFNIIRIVWLWHKNRHID